MIKSKLTTSELKDYLLKSIQNYVINAKDNPLKRTTYQALAKEDHLILKMVFKPKTDLTKFNRELDQGHWQEAIKLLSLKNEQE